MVRMNDILAGAIGGLAGGLMMTAAMAAGKQTGMVETPMPAKVERWAEEQTGKDIAKTPQQEMLTSQGGHLVLSTLFGAGYGALSSTLNTPAIPAGPLYGMTLYMMNLGGIGPALGINKEPWEQEPMTTGRQMMMHLMYGLVTGIVTEQMREQFDGSLHDIERIA